MCMECRQTPCCSACPNAPDPKVRGRCEQCNEELREDYEFYIDVEGNKFCSDICATKYHGIKRVEWIDFEEDYEGEWYKSTIRV